MGLLSYESEEGSHEYLYEGLYKLCGEMQIKKKKYLVWLQHITCPSRVI